MADKKNITFYFSVFVAVFDKQANIHCIDSTSRPISSRYRNATDQAMAMDRFQSYFRKRDNFFSGKQKDAVRTGQKVYSLIYDFCMVVRIFKVTTSLSIFSTTRPCLAQQRKQMKTIKFDNTNDKSHHRFRQPHLLQQRLLILCSFSFVCFSFWLFIQFIAIVCFSFLSSWELFFLF